MHRILRLATSWMLIAFTVAAIAWQLTGEPMVDDLVYQNIPQSTEGFWAKTGPEIHSIGDACEASAGHYLYTHSRLANYLQTFANLIPDWVTRTLHGVTLGLSLLMLWILIGGRAAMRAPGLAGATILTAWVVLPFHNFIIASDYAFNYIWTTALTLLWIYLFLTRRRVGWIVWVVCVLAGLMHEAASLPCCAGALTVILIDGCDRRYRWAMLLTYGVAAATMLFAPGTMSRILGMYSPGHADSLQWQVINILIDAWGVLFAIIACVIAWHKHDIKRFVGQNAFFIVAIIVGFAIICTTLTRARGLWFVDIFGMVMLGRAVFDYYPSWRRGHRVTGWVCVTLTCASLVGCAYYQHSLNTTMRPAINQLPWWTMRVPISPKDPFRSEFIAIARHTGEPYTLFTDVDTPVPGNTGLRGEYPMYYSSRRIPEGAGLYLTFGDPDPLTANPLYTLYNLRRPTPRVWYPYSEWPSVDERGDTTWCYLIVQLRKLDNNRPITSIDYEL